MDPNLKSQIGKSLGRIVNGVGILIAQYKNETSAMVVSWFQQASFDPPMITLAMKEDRMTGRVIRSSGHYVLNVLHTNQKNLIVHFAKGVEEGGDLFKGIPILKQKTGVPILKEALCFLECELRNVYPSGDHQLFLGEVINAGAQEEGAPMVHLRRSGFSY